MRVSLCLTAKLSICGPTITVPSSLASSQITATGGRPASRARSTAASVWPERISTPPSRAISGKTWPGRTKSSAPMLPLASARTVLQRCSAEMPVVMPWRTSAETVKAVPSGASLTATIGARLQPARVVAGQRRADDAAAVADDEGHLLGRAQRGGDDHVALVFAIVVVGDDDDLAARERFDGLTDRVRHLVSLLADDAVVEEIVGRHRAAAVSATMRCAVSRDTQARLGSADLRHRARRYADAPREIGARDARRASASRRASWRQQDRSGRELEFNSNRGMIFSLR